MLLHGEARRFVLRMLLDHVTPLGRVERGVAAGVQRSTHVAYHSGGVCVFVLWDAYLALRTVRTSVFKRTSSVGPDWPRTPFQHSWLHYKGNSALPLFGISSGHRDRPVTLHRLRLSSTTAPHPVP